MTPALDVGSRWSELRNRSRPRGAATGALLAASLLIAGCGGGSSGLGTAADGSVADGASQGDVKGGAGHDLRRGDVAGGPCVGLACQQMSCSGGATTTVTGTVYAPEGTLPIYNVIVYVPNAPLADLAEGASCNLCDSAISGNPVVTAITDTHGKFRLDNVPVGSNIPLVIQVGKWRRTLTLPTVIGCKENPVDSAQTRLPASQAEGSLPKIALTTGSADALECLLRKLGIASSEFTLPTGTGRVHLYAGHGGTDRYVSTLNGGADFQPASKLWGSLDTLRPYDLVLLSCEGNEYPDEKGPDAFKAMHDYTSLGGRVFASHWHEIWLKDGPAPFPDVAGFVNKPDIGDLTASVDTSFPKGQALSEWLFNVGGSTTQGKVDITGAQHTVDSVNTLYGQRWIYSDRPSSVQYLSANTPLGAAAAQQCGRIVLSDIHVAGQGGDKSSTNLRYPDGCTTMGLTPQEKILAYMLFDLSACIIPDSQPPAPPRPQG